MANVALKQVHFMKKMSLQLVLEGDRECDRLPSRLLVVWIWAGARRDRVAEAAVAKVVITRCRIALLNHCGFCFSRGDRFVSPGFPAAAALAEREALLDALRASGRELSVNFAPATTDALRMAITRGTPVLHWSGHGEECGDAECTSLSNCTTLCGSSQHGSNFSYCMQEDESGTPDHCAYHSPGNETLHCLGLAAAANATISAFQVHELAVCNVDDDCGGSGRPVASSVVRPLTAADVSRTK